MIQARLRRSSDNGGKAECHDVEEVKRRDRAVDRVGVCPVLVLVDMKGAKVLGRCGIGRLTEKGDKALDVAQVPVLGARRKPRHHHVVLHPLTQWADGADEVVATASSSR